MKKVVGICLFVLSLTTLQIDILAERPKSGELIPCICERCGQYYNGWNHVCK